MTHSEKMAWQREQRAATGNSYTKKYEKTPRGFLMRAYRNMKSRVTGVQYLKAHLYRGLDIMPREDFYRWSWSNPDFWRLYRQWVALDYDRKLTPSVNRIRTSEGYVPGNVEWLTHSANSALGGMNRQRRVQPNFLEIYAHTKTAAA